MSSSVNSQRDELQAVRHLVALGYVDPDEVAAEVAASRQRQRAAFKDAHALLHAGDRGEAIARLERLIADDPDWVAPRQLLAELYYQAGRLRDAGAQLDWLTWHGVESPRLSLLSGALALTRRDLPAAMDALEYAHHADPTLPQVTMLLGRALLRRGEVDRAEQLLREAVKRNPHDVSALDGLAQIQLRRGDYAAAAEWALAAVDQDMQYWRAHYHLGIALYRSQRFDAALQALAMASRLRPALAAPYRWQARIAEQMGDADRAADFRKQGSALVQNRRRGSEREKHEKDEKGNRS